MKCMRAPRAGVGAAMCLFALGCDMAGPSPVAATSWAVSGSIHGKEKNGKVKPGKDVSGMACAPEQNGKRLCLIVDDETQGAQIMIMDGYRLIAGDYLRLIGDRFEGKPVELDAEAATYAQGAFYIIGSHGRPRHEKEGDEAKNVARQAASSHIFRIVVGDGAVDLGSGAIRSALRVEPSAPLSRYYPPGSALWQSQGQPLEENGLTVEGMAILRGTAVIGFRAPLDAGDNALLLEIPLDDLFGGSGGLVR